MMCPHCGIDSPGAEMFCKKCGKEMNLTFEEVTSALGAEAAGESAAATEEQMRQYLVWAVCLFVVGWIFNGYFKEHPRAVQVPRMVVGAGEAADGRDGFAERAFRPYEDALPIPAIALALPTKPRDLPGRRDDAMRELVLSVGEVIDAFGGPMGWKPPERDD